MRGQFPLTRGPLSQSGSSTQDKRLKDVRARVARHSETALSGTQFRRASPLSPSRQVIVVLHLRQIEYDVEGSLDSLPVFQASAVLDESAMTEEPQVTTGLSMVGAWCSEQ